MTHHFPALAVLLSFFCLFSAGLMTWFPSNIVVCDSEYRTNLLPVQEIHLCDFELSLADSFGSTPCVWLAELEQDKNKSPFVLVSHSMWDSHDTGLGLNSLSIEETGVFFEPFFTFFKLSFKNRCELNEQNHLCFFGVEKDCFCCLWSLGETKIRT